MTQEVLVAVISLFCGGTATSGNIGNMSITKSEAKEARINCMEIYVNCAVGPNGKIMEMSEFITKCKGK